MKRIPDYPAYLVSEAGQIYKQTGAVRVPVVGVSNGLGYLQVGLTKDGKRRRFYVHRLVASAYVPNPNNCPEVDHVDECKSNNQHTNLAWVTRSQNQAKMAASNPHIAGNFKS